MQARGLPGSSEIELCGARPPRRAAAGQAEHRGPEHRGLQHKDPDHRGLEHRGPEHRGPEHRSLEHRGFVIAPKKTGEATKQEERRRHLHQVGSTSQALHSHEAGSHCSNKANFRCVVPISVDRHRR